MTYRRMIISAAQVKESQPYVFVYVGLSLSLSLSLFPLLSTSNALMSLEPDLFVHFLVSFPSLCRSVQNVMTDMAFNLGRAGLGSFSNTIAKVRRRREEGPCVVVCGVGGCRCLLFCVRCSHMLSLFLFFSLSLALSASHVLSLSNTHTRARARAHAHMLSIPRSIHYTQINSKDWAGAAAGMKASLWCRQVGSRCTEDAAAVAAGC